MLRSILLQVVVILKSIHVRGEDAAALSEVIKTLTDIIEACPNAGEEEKHGDQDEQGRNV